MQVVRSQHYPMPHSRTPPTPIHTRMCRSRLLPPMLYHMCVNTHTGGRGDDRRGGEDGHSGKRQKAHFVEQDVLGVFDLNTKTWLPLVAAGKAPCPRSSHRAVTLSDRIIIYGGAVKGGWVLHAWHAVVWPGKQQAGLVARG